MLWLTYTAGPTSACPSCAVTEATEARPLAAKPEVGPAAVAALPAVPDVVFQMPATPAVLAVKEVSPAPAAPVSVPCKEKQKTNRPVLDDPDEGISQAAVSLTPLKAKKKQQGKKKKHNSHDVEDEEGQDDFHGGVFCD